MWLEDEYKKIKGDTMKKYFTNGEQTIKVSVDYDLGGYNHWSGGTTRRGVYVYVTPVELKGMWEKTELGSGVKKMIKELGRKSQKVINETFEKVDEIVPELFEYIGYNFNEFKEMDR